MMQISITNIPNQSLTVRLDNHIYDIVLKTISDTACIDLSRDGVVVLLGERITPGTPILPYKYLENGNFMLSTLNDDLPDYTKFGISQMLFYLTVEELADARA